MIFNRVYIEKKIKSLNLTRDSSVTLVLAQEPILESTTSATQSTESSLDSSMKKAPLKYPINRLRNLVISSTFTKYILLVDADFAPSVNIDQIFQSTLSSMEHQCNSKCAFIVPAFEWLHPDQVCIEIF